MGQELAGKVAVVTGVGAHAGLGNSMARVFAAAGAKVVGADLREDRGPEVERAIREEGGEFDYVHADLRKVEDCERVIQKAIDLHGRVDVLVNNAMVNPDPFGPSHEMSEDVWDNCVDTIMKGTMFCSRFALRHMLAQESGVIINISSAAAIGAFPRNRAYGAAKAAVLHLSAGMAEEYRDRGIRVHGIIMGAVASDEYQSQWSRSPRTAAMPPAEREEFLKFIAARATHPDEIARQILAIAATESRWRSGDAIEIPGSKTMLAPTAAVIIRATPG